MYGGCNKTADSRNTIKCTEWRKSEELRKGHETSNDGSIIGCLLFLLNSYIITKIVTSLNSVYAAHLKTSATKNIKTVCGCEGKTYNYTGITAINFRPTFLNLSCHLNGDWSWWGAPLWLMWQFSLYTYLWRGMEKYMWARLSFSPEALLCMKWSIVSHLRKNCKSTVSCIHKNDWHCKLDFSPLTDIYFLEMPLVNGFLLLAFFFQEQKPICTWFSRWMSGTPGAL